MNGLRLRSGKKTDTYFAELFWLVQGRNRVSLINEFFKNLSAGEAVSINADLREIHTYMGPNTRTTNNRLHVLVAELLGKEFPLKVSAWMEVKVTAVGKRYPLLTMMSPVGQSWDDLKAEMIRYLKTC